MNYKLLEQQNLEDINSQGYIYEHITTKAKICFIENQDDNKTFSIAFRTPPMDNTGAPHILEHCVLNGSKKYPLKDPFIELAKGSLNTFLNAITFPDKTIYPVASVNDKDFHNLVDVYLDSVFNPLIYQNEKTFLQEGWHYELKDKDDKVSYNGVVYNEMKGSFSSPERILYESIQQQLFKGHLYGNVSGGDPEDIPKLSYSAFLDFHRRYYHPSNSYIFYYGKLDREAELAYLDQEYLSHYQYLEVESAVPLMKRYTQSLDVELEYPIGEQESEAGKYFYSYNVLLDETNNIANNYLFEVLEYLLVEAPGAVIKEALLKAELCEDVFASHDSELREGMFSIIAKNAKKGQKQQFVQIIEQELDKLIENGLDLKRAEATVNRYEFRAKESDYGQYPKGVIYSISSLDTWLHGGSPFAGFHYGQIFAAVRAGLNKEKMAELMKRYLRDNQHKLILTLAPSKTYNSQKQEKTSRQLADYEQGLTDEQRRQLVSSTAELIAYQNQPDTPETIEKLPLLLIEDINRDNKPFQFERQLVGDTMVLSKHADAGDIVYLTLSFDISTVPEKDLAYVSFLSRLLSMMSTKRYNYLELADQINAHTGGVSAMVTAYEHKQSTKYYTPVLEIRAKCFVRNLDKLYDLLTDILTNTLFDNISRIRELLQAVKSKFQTAILSSGHSLSINRARSYLSVKDSYMEKIKGIEFYHDLLEWVSKPDKELEELGCYLSKVLGKVVSAEALTVGLTYSAEQADVVSQKTQDFIKTLPMGDQGLEKAVIPLLQSPNEGFKTSSNVNYVSLVGNYKSLGYEFSGSLRVLNTILNLDYLWNNIRAKGGAYGAFSGVERNGIIYLASYRDPNLANTLEVYQEMDRYIASIDISDRERTKYIIGTIRSFDIPTTPSMENSKMMNRHFSEITSQEMDELRHQILDTTVEQLRSHSELYKKTIENANICVIGNDKMIDQQKELFAKTNELA